MAVKERTAPVAVVLVLLFSVSCCNVSRAGSICASLDVNASSLRLTRHIWSVTNGETEELQLREQ